MAYKSFEELDGWKMGCHLAVRVYEVLKECRDFGGSAAELRTQIYIACQVGIISNDTQKEFTEELKKISSPQRTPPSVSGQCFLDHSDRPVVVLSKGGWIMPRITLKETITRKIDIPLDTLVEVIDSLTADEREKLMSRIGASPSLALKKFKKDKLVSILSDFAESGLYEQEFLIDLEAGLRKSSAYR